MAPNTNRRLTVFSHLNSRDSHVQRQVIKRQDDENDEQSTSLEALDLYLKEISRYPLLTKEQEVEYSQKAQQGDLAYRDMMIQSNLRLVVKIARRYLKSGMLFLDLIEEGNLGLLHALDKFDPDKGCRFSTYSAWWIQQSIERSIMNQGKTVRIPIHIAKLQNSINKTSRSLSMDQYHVDIKVIAEKLGKKESDIERAVMYQESNISMDAPINGDIETSFVNILQKDSIDDPYHNMLNQGYQNSFYKLIQDLPKKNFDVIARRYGLFGFDAMTLQETGEDLGITREKVRQIQVQTINMLSKKNLDDLEGSI